MIASGGAGSARQARLLVFRTMGRTLALVVGAEGVDWDKGVKVRFWLGDWLFEYIRHGEQKMKSRCVDFALALRLDMLDFGG